MSDVWDTLSSLLYAFRRRVSQEEANEESESEGKAKSDVPCAAMKRILSKSSALTGRGVASMMTVEEEGEALLCDGGDSEEASSALEDEEATASVRPACADFFFLVEDSARLPPTYKCLNMLSRLPGSEYNQKDKTTT